MLDEMFARVDQLLADWNRQDSPYTIPLGFSKGGAVFDPAIDSQYRQVFKRADEQMYADKAAYYRRVGDRRRHY